MARILIVLVLLIASSGLHCHSPTCPPSCSCPGPSVVNCSLAGLRAMPQIVDSVAHLDVSHNWLERLTLVRRTLPQLRSLRLANNSVARLTLCIHGRVQEQGCASWAPNLRLLSVERNQLRRLPRGLSALEVLEVLQLSFNRITTIQLGELDNLRGLRELHLQHNLISSLHPHVLRHLHQLEILDVSYNMLTSLHPSIYLSLRTIGADINLAGNRWHCDCSMRSIRRWMTLDRSTGSRSWDLVCASPPILAGADVLQLEDDNLNCWSTEKELQLHQDVMVYRGSKVLLSCATEGASWWTPAGLAPANQPQSGLLISAVTEKNSGLYVCLSKDHQVVSVFHLRIGGTSRKARSVPERITGEERSQSVTQSDLTLAVCLSVFITFLVAFILGVLLRPCIDMLWKRITKKKTSNSVSSAEERQYDNEAYSEGEDPEELRPHRERRVTFSTVDFREENDVKYYDTERETRVNGTVVECETVVDGDSGSEKSLERSDSVDTRGLSNQNPKKKTSFSDCSLSDQDQNEVETVQQTSTELPQISINKIPGFSSEPIADCIPHPNNSGMLAAEPEDDEEQFDFSDSVRSSSPKTSSPMGSFNYSRQIMPRLNRKDSSSSSSYISDDEPLQYTVNPDPQEEEVRKSYAKTNVSDTPASLKSTREYKPTLDQNTELWWPAVDLEDSMRVPRRIDIKVRDSDGQTTSFREKPGTGMVVTAGVAPSSSFSSSNREKDTRHPITPLPVLDLEHTISFQRRIDIKAPSLTSDSSIVTDSEDESISLTETSQTVDRAGLQGQEVRQATHTRWPTIDLQQLPHSERHQNVKSTIPDSSSSSDSEEVIRVSMAQPLSKVSPSYDPQAPWSSIDLEDSFRIKRCLDVKPLPLTSGSTSSIDSEDETIYYTQRQAQGTIQVTGYPIKAPPTLRYDPQSHWPSIDLEDSFRIKKRLDVKPLSSTSGSTSSSNSEDGTMHYTQKQEKGTVKVNRDPIKAIHTPSYDVQSHWPSIDLEDSFRIKKRLDVKPLSSTSGSTSSINSEDGTTKSKSLWPSIDLEDSFRIKRRLNIKAPSPPVDLLSTQGSTKVTRYPSKASPTPSYDPQAPWPSVNLEDSFQIKRRLDVKAPSPKLESSSNSDSDDEITDRITKLDQGTIKVTRDPIKAPPTQSYDPQSPWPSIDLEDSFRTKRCLNVKAPSDSSSSSDSEHEATHHITKHEEQTNTATRYSTNTSQTPNYDPQASWPSVNLEDYFQIKRRLDVKTTSPKLESSSNSDSDDEITDRITKLDQGTIKVTWDPIKAPPTQSYDPQSLWPSIDQENSFKIKRRLNIKAPSPPSDSLSSSDSENETTHHITKQEQGAKYHTEASPTPGYDPKAPWPSVDLEDSFQIKRRLNVKTTSPKLDASSNSNSDDEMTNRITKLEQGTTKVTRDPIKAPPTQSYDPQSLWPSIDLEDSFKIKRRLNVKEPSPPSDSLSSSNSENKTTHHITKLEQGAKYHTEASPTPSYDPKAPWPSVDLEDSFRTKRRLDVKPPSPTLDASSNSSSDDEMTNRITKLEQGTIKVTRYPMKAPPTQSCDPQSLWPSIDLENYFRIKKHLNVKAPSDSSSSSDSEHETIHHITKHEQEASKVTRYSTKASLTPYYDSQAPWLSVNLEDSLQIKRRLDVKTTSPKSESSSNSDDEMTDRITKLDQGTIKVTRYPIKAPPTQTYDNPQSRWPSIDLEDSFKIKRRLNVKAPSPPLESSSSSDSENKTTHYITKQEQGAKYHTEASPTPSYDPKAPWPSVDLEDSFRTKRRLDVKAPSPTLDASSNSSSDDEMTNRITKQEQGAKYHTEASPTASYDPKAPWPCVDLEDSLRTKRRLDVKAPSPTLDASSNSSSDDETTHHVTEKVQAIKNVTRRPIKAPPTPSYDPQAPWLSIDLEDSFPIKRSLDVKVLSPPSDSSSTDSEDEAKNHTQKQGTTNETRYPPKAPLPSCDSQAPWPALDFEDSFRIKRSLNIKALSLTSDSLSNSNSNHETNNQPTEQEPQITNANMYPIKTPLTVSYDPQVLSPSIDLENSFRIKRRLDIKARLPSSDSSSSSGNDHETIYKPTKQKHKITEVTSYPIKVPPTSSYHPHAPWPSVVPEGPFKIKRRLNIKTLSPTSDSFSSSDTEDGRTNHITKQEQETTKVTSYPIKPPPTSSYNLLSPWPLITLEDSFRIKRRLNVKAPSPPSVSSSSSSSDHELSLQPTKQMQRATNIIKYPSKVVPTPSYDPELARPSLDLENSFQIKRRLDFKTPSPTSFCLSSSESEDEIMYNTQKHEQGTTKITSYPIKGSPSPSYGTQSAWPSLDLEGSFRIKRRLNINAPSPPSYSVSNSDCEYEMTHRIIKQEQGARDARYPTQVPPRPSSNPQSPWFSLDLEDSFRIKRRLDFNVPTSDSPSSSIKQEQGNTNIARYPITDFPTPGHNSQGIWSSLDLEDSLRIKRRLEIKAAPADVSNGVRQDHTVGGNQLNSSNKRDNVHADATETQVLPRVSLGVSRRLDIRAPSPQPQLAPDSVSAEAWDSKSNCSTSNSDDENRDGLAVKSPVIIVPRNSKRDPDIKLEKYIMVPEIAGDETSNATTQINPELQSRWANMHLGFSRFRKRLEITSHSHEPSVVPLSESETGAAKLKQTVDWQEIKRIQSPQTPRHIHDTTDKPVASPTSEGTPNLPLIKRYLDVKAPVTLQEHLDSSSSNGNEGESTEYSQWRGTSHVSQSSLNANQNVETRQTKEKSQVTTVLGQFSSSSSEDETVEVVEVSKMTEVARSVTPDTESPIQYRRLIIKASSLPNDTSTRDQHTAVRDSSYSTRYQLPSLAQKTIPNPRSGDSSPRRDEHDSSYSTNTIPGPGYGDDTPTIDPLGVNTVTTQLDSSYSARYKLPYTARYQKPYFAPKTTASPGSGNNISTMDHSVVNTVTTQHDSSYSARYQTLYVAPNTTPSPGSGDDTPPARDPSGVNITTQSGSSYSTRYQIPSLAPRPFRSSTEGPSAEIRWTGLRTRLSDLSKHPNPSLPSTREGLQKTLAGSITQEVAREKQSTTMTRSLNLSSGSLSSFSTDAMSKGASQKRERRGLSALKAMSSERQTWDSVDEKLNYFQESGSSGNFNQDRSELLISYTSTSNAEDVSYDIPRYRTHAPLIKEIPPPVPTTPLPDDAVELTWNSKSSYTTSISQV
ncbi:leucine rich repeat containing 66 [Festucalex cinctus]